eukprot:XP_003244271.1 PREDICTED: bromodomain-containing protein 4 isoform X1 [Acyrthosiphon pisum]
MSNQIEHVKTILNELVGRTKDFQNLNAFRLFILQHNTYDVDKATMLIKRAHEELNYLDMMTEKSEANAAATPSVVLTAHQQQVLHGRQSVNRPPASALIGHHHHHQPSQPTPPQQPPPPSHHQPAQPPHNQQPPLHHNRSSSSLSGTDYREPATTTAVIALEPGGSAVGRRPAVNGSVSNVLGARPVHPAPGAVLYPRPMYPFALPLPTPPALWHHAQPHFPTASFQPFMENEWTRHCRLPMFNPELQPELQPEQPVNLQNNHHHRRSEPGRPLEIPGRLQQERSTHSRPAPANPLAHDDRQQTRHHA